MKETRFHERKQIVFSLTDIIFVIVQIFHCNKTARSWLLILFVCWQHFLSECLSKTKNINASVLVRLLQLLFRLLWITFHSKSRCHWRQCWKLKFKLLEMLVRFLFAGGRSILWEECSGVGFKVEECFFWKKEQPTIVFWFQKLRFQKKEHRNVLLIFQKLVSIYQTHFLK